LCGEQQPPRLKRRDALRLRLLRGFLERVGEEFRGQGFTCATRAAFGLDSLVLRMISDC
jgi:hypothetical protein